MLIPESGVGQNILALHLALPILDSVLDSPCIFCTDWVPLSEIVPYFMLCFPSQRPIAGLTSTFFDAWGWTLDISHSQSAPLPHLSWH